MHVKESRLKDDRVYDRLQLSPPFCETWPLLVAAPLVFPNFLIAEYQRVNFERERDASFLQNEIATIGEIECMSQ